MKNFVSVFSAPTRIMGKSNMLTQMDIDDEMRLGIYYIMDVFGLVMSVNSYGSWEWISFHKKEGDPALTGDQIVDLPYNAEKLAFHKNNHDHGIFPEKFRKMTENRKDENKEECRDFEYARQYGWLAPDGKFYTSDWGTHEEKAEELLKQIYGLSPDDYLFVDKEYHLARDYLCLEKGWVLIDAPNGMDICVTEPTGKSITKKQREFLYVYFSEIGNFAKAYYYMGEES